MSFLPPSRKIFEYAGLVLLWLGLVLFFGMFTENFLSRGALGALANRIPPLTVIATGMTLVLIVGGIDLSVGSVLGLCGALLGTAITIWHWPLGLAAILCLAAGLCVGSLNGALSVLLGIPSFIVTLGMLEVARGLAYLTTGSRTQYIGASIGGLAEPLWGGAVSPALLLAVGVVLAGQVLLSKTVAGRQMIALGSNEQAARLAGIPTRKARIGTFALLGLLTGLAAIFYTARLGSADPNAGAGMELSAIAAVVIGGASLSGGHGSVLNTFFGVLIIATLEAGLAQGGISEPVKRVITGAVIVAAVSLDAWRRRWAIRRLLAR